jgi:hypothetical protein
MQASKSTTSQALTGHDFIEDISRYGIIPHVISIILILYKLLTALPT